MDLRLVTGKGGVGKSRTTLLLAKTLPQVIVSETANSLDSFAKELKIKLPKRLVFKRENLAEELLVAVVKIKTVAHWLSQSKLFQTLLQLAPNLHELLLLREWTRQAEARTLLVDAPSTGHFLALFEAVQTARTLFDGGRLRELADHLHDLFTRGEGISVYIVSLPEHSALEEMRQIEEKLETLYPKIRRYKILNRQHKASCIPADKLSPNLHDLAYQRPALEAERVSAIKFDSIIPEGEINL